MRVNTLAILFIVVLAGCGLMSKGTKQVVTIDSAPPSQKVEVDGEAYTTPAHVRLARYYDHRVTVANDRGATVERMIHSVPDYFPWSYIGFAFTTFISPMIDNYVGADRRLEPAQLVIPLPPADAGPEFRSPAPPNPIWSGWERRGLPPKE